MAEEIKYVEVNTWGGRKTKVLVGMKCNIQQYRLLEKCSKRNDSSLWNQYRDRHPNDKIILQGACLKNFNLENINFRDAELRFAQLEKTNLKSSIFFNAQLEELLVGDNVFFDGADFRFARLDHACLSGAHFTKAKFHGAHLEHASLVRAHFEHADLPEAQLKYAQLQWVHLECANLRKAHLEHAILWGAFLDHANLAGAYLEKADFNNSDLTRANLLSAQLSGAIFTHTILENAAFCDNSIDTQTDFTGSNIQEARMSPELEAQLEYNIRRKSWKKWMQGKFVSKDVRGLLRIWYWIQQVSHWCIISIVWLFWWITDYGSRSGRLLWTFLLLSFGFAILYWRYPHYVMGLSLKRVDDIVVGVSGWMLALRSFYFSIVTMTTLGFGDIYADPRYWQGHVLLSLQVLFGYFLLGALVTRLGIMFTSKAPCPEVPRADEDKWHYPLRQLWKKIRGKDSSSNGDGPAKTETR